MRDTGYSVNEIVRYSLEDGIATITIDDGKRNALPPPVLKAIHRAFARARADRAAVVLTGREDVFSAGFDLNVMKRGGPDALRMLYGGYSLPARVLTHPRPVVAACNGHSFAMGVFLMLGADYVIGSEGDFGIAANEVAIGLKMPRVAAAMLRHRLTPATYQRAVALAEKFDPDAAVAAGFLDEVVAPAELAKRATEKIHELKALHFHAHMKSKRRIRRSLVRKLKASVPLDLVDALWMGIRGGGPRQ